MDCEIQKLWIGKKRKQIIILTKKTAKWYEQSQTTKESTVT